jgi:hypothetical protein
VQEQVGVRLTARHLLGREARGLVEQRVQTGQLQRQPYLLQATLRGDAHRDARRGDLRHRVSRAGDRLQLATEHLRTFALVAVEPALGQRAPQQRRRALVDLLQQHALVGRPRLCQRRRQTVARQRLREHRVRDDLAVDENAVAVEDHELRWRHPVIVAARRIELRCVLLGRTQVPSQSCRLTRRGIPDVETTLARDMLRLWLWALCRNNGMVGFVAPRGHVRRVCEGGG